MPINKVNGNLLSAINKMQGIADSAITKINGQTIGEAIHSPLWVAVGAQSLHTLQMQTPQPGPRLRSLVFRPLKISHSERMVVAQIHGMGVPPQIQKEPFTAQTPQTPIRGQQLILRVPAAAQL